MTRIILTLLLLPMMTASAQPGKMRPHGKDSAHLQAQRMQAMEVAFMTRELALTAEEAQKFWPVFNKYRDEVKEVQKNKSLTDPLDRQQKVLDIRKRYRSDFNRMLGQDRGMRIYPSEDRFRQMVQKTIMIRQQARKRAGQMQRQNPNGPRGQLRPGRPGMRPRLERLPL